MPYWDWEDSPVARKVGAQALMEILIRGLHLFALSERKAQTQ